MIRREIAAVDTTVGLFKKKRERDVRLTGANYAKLVSTFNNAKR